VQGSLYSGMEIGQSRIVKSESLELPSCGICSLYVAVHMDFRPIFDRLYAITRR
jgi:hypothetical protein